MSATNDSAEHPQEGHNAGRRDFLTKGTSAAMAGGLLAGYGSLGVMAAQFLYPSGDDSMGWCFLATLDDLAMGQSMTFVAPSGAKVVVARQSEGETAEDFIALSSVCPHLGCQVHWEPHNDRFFCPCHNGVFDPQGNPLEGPPAQGGQQLMRFQLRIEDGMLYILAPLAAVGRSVAQTDSPMDDQPSRGEEA